MIDTKESLIGNITQSGELSGVVNKEVQVIAPTLQEKETTPTQSTQTILPDSNYDGLSSVVVNPIPSEYIIPSGTLEIESNGNYNVRDYNQANVNIPSGGGVDINDYFLTQPTEAVSLGTTWLKQIPTFDCSLLTTMAGLFSSCDFLGHTLKVSCNDSITSLYRTFYYTVNAKTIDLSLCNTSNVTSMQDMFRANSNPYDTTVKTIIFGSNFSGVKTTTTSRMFQNRRGLTVIDLSNFETTNKLLNTQYMFAQCINLTKIDMRKMYLNNVNAYDNMFQNIPNNCEIIVKDNTQKTWITSKFTSLTNVKTVAEYEGQVN